VQLQRYVRERHPGVAPSLAAALVAFHPGAVFYSSIYTESPFLLLAVTALRWSARGAHGRAALALALLGATRLPGGFVVAVVLADQLLWPAADAPPRRERLRRAAGYALMGNLGLALFLAYQQLAVGRWNAFIVAQQGWGRTGGPNVPARLLAEVRFALTSAFARDAVPLSDIVVALAVLALSLAFLRDRAYRRYAPWGLLAVLVPVASGTFSSCLRYTMVFFPAQIWLAQRLGRAPSAVAGGLLALSGAALFALSVLFTRNYFVG
jgi:hypothetical protein